MDKERNIVSSYNITGSSLSNVGNVTNVTVSHPMGSSGQPLTLESKVAFGALLNSAERYPAPHCHPGTRIAAKKVTKDWIGRRGFGSEKRIMWISGGPGVGKSAVLQTVCEELTGYNEFDFVSSEEDNGLIDACYFFGRGMGDREKASFFPATIAYQLVFSRASCGAAIQKIVAKKSFILLDSFPSQFRKLVLKPAKALAESEAPVTIVIDALDECDNVGDQLSLLKVIFEGATSANMRFVIASRPEEDICAFFQHTTVAEHTYCIRLDDDFKASRDIEIFLVDEFAGIRARRPGLCLRLPNGEEWPGSVVIYRLRDDSDGQFIYPALVIAFIDTSYPPPDQQLKSLLAAQHTHHAFSKLDSLYHHILSRCPPGLLARRKELPKFQELVKEILRVVVCWPKPLSAAGIAEVLDKQVDVVRAVIYGPMRSLFKFDKNGPHTTISLCHKSLRDHLLDLSRSHEFFLQDANTPDTLYTEILSRRPPSDLPQSYSREVLMGVLSMVVVLGNRVVLKVTEIASFLDVEPRVVEGVIFGPAGALFEVDTYNMVGFFNSSVKAFLLDVNRARDYFIPRDKPLDFLFTQLLSRQPSGPSQPYSRELLMGVLTIVMERGNWVTVPQIASFLNVGPGLVEGVVFGPAKPLFKLGGKDCTYVNFTIPSKFKDFLLDASRAGDFFIPRNKIDSHFIQILSHQPSGPSRSHSQEVLMGVLRVLVVWGRWLTVAQIASSLDVDPAGVNGIVFGKDVFRRYDRGAVELLPYVAILLQDANRAGEYYIPPKCRNPNYASMYAKIRKICCEKS